MILTELISIIIPVHNGEEYIERCVSSILCQTYKNLEIIVIDDGSTDKTLSICKSLASNDDRIVLMHQSNQGVSSARNKGIRVAKGDYIGFVDADDWIEKDMYEMLYNLLTKEHANISICGYIYEDIHGRVIKRSVEELKTYRLSSQEGIEMMFDDRYYHGFLWNKLFRVDLFKNKDKFKNLFDTEISIGEDRLMTFRCMLASDKIVYNPDVKYHYLLNPTGSVNSDFSKKKLSGFKVYDYVFQELPANYKNALRKITCTFIDYNISLIAQIMKSKYNDRKLINELRKNVKRHFNTYISSNSVSLKHKILAIAILINPYFLRLRHGLSCLI